MRSSGNVGKKGAIGMKARFDSVGQAGREAKRLEKNRKTKESMCQLVVQAVMKK